MGDEVKESRREQLSKAWEAVEEKEDETKSEPIKRADESDDSGPEVSSTGKDNTEETLGEQAEKPEVDKTATDPDKKEAKAAAELERKAERQPAPAVNDRAPNSWKPAIREHWGKLPAEVRAEITQRELSIQQELTRTGQVRKFAQDFATVVNPYSHLIRAQNSTPLQAVQNLMQTAAGLMQGNQEQKARIVSEIIANYGVDVQTLDHVLSQGAYNPHNVMHPQTAAVPQWATPIFGFMDKVQKMQEQQQQQMQIEADQAIEALSTKPFFDDLREDMADIMEFAANKGKKMTIEKAYEQALIMRPDLKKIIDQRKLAENNRNPVSEAAAVLARARKASSSVKGAPAGDKAGAPNGKLTRRQQIAQAWNDQEQ